MNDVIGVLFIFAMFILHVAFIIGIINPKLFTKLFKHVPTRLKIFMMYIIGNVAILVSVFLIAFVWYLFNPAEESSVAESTVVNQPVQASNENTDVDKESSDDYSEPVNRNPLHHWDNLHIGMIYKAPDALSLMSMPVPSSSYAETVFNLATSVIMPKGVFFEVIDIRKYNSSVWYFISVKKGPTQGWKNISSGELIDSEIVDDYFKNKRLLCGWLSSMAIYDTYLEPIEQAPGIYFKPSSITVDDWWMQTPIMDMRESAP